MSGSEINRSHVVDLAGTEVHYVDFGGAADGPTVLLVHGLGGSHLNWDLLAPKLTPATRVVALDLPGFGLSAPTGRPATVRGNVDVLGKVMAHVSDTPVVLVGNSMGGLVSVLATARMPQLVRGLVLIDPALPAAQRVLRTPADAWNIATYALPGIGERRRRARRHRIGALDTLRETLVRGGVDEATLPAGLIERSVAIVERQSEIAGMDRAYLSASRSLVWTLFRAPRYHSAMSSIEVPVLLMHGDQDQLVPVTAARSAARHHPAWRYIELAGEGHTPQLQSPDTVAAYILEWLAELPRDVGQQDPDGQDAQGT
jgi:pimeloyl-ACP methyl ester carboxylesterase